MTDTRLADVAEFRTVDWPAYTEPAVIIRALYGTSHVDLHWAANIAGARANARIRVRGIYQYVVAGQDITAQANALVALVKRLQPGEFAIADIEEGTGDLQARFETWARIVHAGLGGVEGEYSGVSFARAHLEDFAGASLVWVAAYQANEPTDHHQLWQYTDAQSFAGISAPCDGSVFHGSIDDLLALIGAAPASPAPPAPTRRPLMDRQGLISFLANAICARDATADELTALSQPGVTDRQVVLHFEDSPDGTAIKLSRRAAAGLH